jgi:hypothetical protein
MTNKGEQLIGFDFKHALKIKGEQRIAVVWFTLKNGRLFIYLKLLD